MDCCTHALVDPEVLVFDPPSFIVDQVDGLKVPIVEEKEDHVKNKLEPEEVIAVGLPLVVNDVLNGVLLKQL